MPTPTTAPLRGLAAAASPDELIAQRMKVNQAMSGGGAVPPPQTPPPARPAPPGGIQIPAGVPDPSGMLAALKQAGYTGQRTGDIELHAEPDADFDDLMRRSEALLRSR